MDGSRMGLSLMGWVMAVSPFVREAVYDPEIIKVMAGAYEELLGDLELTDRDHGLAEVIAKGVLQAARQGVHDVAEMRQRVLRTLGRPH
jgi:hypothetical protein